MDIASTKQVASTLALLRWPHGTSADHAPPAVQRALELPGTLVQTLYACKTKCRRSRRPICRNLQCVVLHKLCNGVGAESRRRAPFLMNGRNHEEVRNSEQYSNHHRCKQSQGKTQCKPPLGTFMKARPYEVPGDYP